MIVLDGDTSSSDDEIEVLPATHSKSGCSARLRKQEAEQTTLKKRGFKLYSQNYIHHEDSDSKAFVNTLNFESNRSRSTNSSNAIRPCPILGATNFSSRRKRRRVAAQDLVSSDYAYALALQAKEEDRAHQKFEDSKSDQMLAVAAQKEECEKYRKADPNKEHTDMTENKTGRVVLAVQRIIDLVRELKMKYPMYAANIDPVATDDMVYLAERLLERLLERQEEFVQDNIPSHVDIGYHYTNPPNMQAIRTNGLMTKGERKSQHITSSTTNGSVFGDAGICSGNNPKSFRNYGSIGLLVARLQGNTVKVPRDLKAIKRQKIIQADTNTVIGDKMNHKVRRGAGGWPQTDKYHEIVLRSSSQCLPMVKYDGSMIAHANGRQCIEYFKLRYMSYSTSFSSATITAEKIMGSFDTFIMVEA